MAFDMPAFRYRHGAAASVKGYLRIAVRSCKRKKTAA
jgi:hypothetical protein